MKSKVRIRFLGIFLCVFLCFATTFKFLQNDTFYIIKLGEYISKYGIDSIDHYSIFNLSYTYPHWLYDLIMYRIYSLGGYYGVYLSVIICFIMLSLVIYYVNLKLHRNEFLAIFVSVISIFILNIIAVARGQLISLIFFVLEVYFIIRLLDSNKNKYILYLMICSLIIANVHATAWLMFFILYLPFIGEDITYLLCSTKFFKNVYKLDVKNKDYRFSVGRINNIKKLYLSGILCFLMGLFTPSKICYTYVIRIMMGDSQKLLAEHLPLVIIEHYYFLILIVIFLIVLIFTKTKVKLNEMYMLFGLFGMSLLSTRHLMFFYSIGLIYIANICYRALVDLNDKSFDIIMSIILNKKVYCILILIVSIYSIYRYNEHSKESYVEKKYYPVDAVLYIKNNLDYKNIRMYNGYNYGSYLLFNDIPVFIDSRCDLYLEEFNHVHSYFDDMENIAYTYEKLFLKYDIEYVIANRDEPLYVILGKDINYEIIYKDKYFKIYKRLDYEKS